MSLINDIANSYRQPGPAVMKQVAGNLREAQTLFYAMLFGFMNFLAGLPVLSMEAGPDRPLFALAAANLVVTLFFVPLMLFAFAAICGFVVKLMGGFIRGDVSRRCVAWSALVAAPLVLISGLIAPIVPAWVLTLVHFLVAIIFFRQLFIGLSLFGLRKEGQV